VNATDLCAGLLFGVGSKIPLALVDARGS